jgi:hypothetical protein
VLLDQSCPDCGYFLARKLRLDLVGYCVQHCIALYIACTDNNYWYLLTVSVFWSFNTYCKMKEGMALHRDHPVQFHWILTGSAEYVYTSVHLPRILIDWLSSNQRPGFVKLTKSGRNLIN